MNNKKPAKKLNQPIRDDRPPLRRQNYMLILIGFGIIILGCLLMIGNTDIYDFRKTVLAPVIIVFGFVFEIYAIMSRPRTDAGTDIPA